ncbi:hypothetical protein BDV96DRAFT_374609 [Lophiotrema nucula]|uniref:Uncharacterized protein n=1 Tax=Lophiotrema nucula TaxID=690887 RepID=A0A6A5YDS8_9PLEO|nr:hypothetical protein BDV96DRAFT_374609 [Lophiotrema nucula]
MDGRTHPWKQICSLLGYSGSGFRDDTTYVKSIADGLPFRYSTTRHLLRDDRRGFCIKPAFGPGRILTNFLDADQMLLFHTTAHARKPFEVFSILKELHSFRHFSIRNESRKALDPALSHALRLHCAYKTLKSPTNPQSWVSLRGNSC